VDTYVWIYSIDIVLWILHSIYYNKGMVVWILWCGFYSVDFIMSVL